MSQHESVVATLREVASDEGFGLFGIAPAVSSSGYAGLVEWISAGYAGGMDYFSNRQEAYQHPAGVLQGAKSVIVMTYPYPSAACSTVPSGSGRVARYVWNGDDYHDTLHPKLKRLARRLKESLPGSNARGVVDTAPLLEREIANLAGLGWTGKNTLLLNKQAGSYFFLACVLSDQALPYDEPHATSHCGSCTACLDACPTDAFPRPGVLDATRCISYLTIEHRDPIPLELREAIGDWFFGCDVCQEVCPWNRKPTRNSTQQDFSLDSVELPSLFQLSEDQFRQRFRKTPLWRTRRRGVLRNAAIVLGNQRCDSSLPALTVGMNDSDSMVRGAAAWALGRIASSDSLSVLRDRQKTESDPEVLAEIENALEPFAGCESP